MIKSIGLALVAIVAVLSFAPAAQAQTVSGAQSVVASSQYWSIWHKPEHGYKMQTIGAGKTSLPERYKEIRRCGGGYYCRYVITAYYRVLHHEWLALNRSLNILYASYPACDLAQPHDCIPPSKGPWRALDYQGVIFIVRNVPAS